MTGFSHPCENRRNPGGMSVTTIKMEMVRWYDFLYWSNLIFSGTKAMGRSWYGFANGVEWAYDCAEQIPPTCPEVPEWPYDNRGYWAESYQAWILFYEPEDLGSVAAGATETWEPQPYAFLDITPVLFDPQ
jgi:hypothetical protein